MHHQNGFGIAMIFRALLISKISSWSKIYNLVKTFKEVRVSLMQFIQIIPAL